MQEDDDARLIEHLQREEAAARLRKEVLAPLTDKHFGKREATVAPLRPDRRRSKSVAYLAIAASIALLLALLPNLILPAAPPNYSDFNDHATLSLLDRGGADAEAISAQTAYNNGNYADAIPPLERYLEIRQDDARASLALGVSYLETGKLEAAKAIFTRIAAAEGPMQAYGNWYLALTAVKEGDTEAAKNYLERIPNTDSYLAERVRKLKAEL